MFLPGGDFIKRFVQNSKNIKCSYINRKYSRGNDGATAQTHGAVKIKNRISAPKCPIIGRNSRNFKLLFFILPHRGVREKLFSQKTFLICSVTLCETFVATLFSYAKLQLQKSEASPYFHFQNRKKSDFENNFSKKYKV